LPSASVVIVADSDPESVIVIPGKPVSSRSRTLPEIV
jgi:hypothetical protein